MSNKLNEIDFEPPGCTNPPNPEEDTAYLDSAASITILGKKAKCNTAAVQEPNIELGTPSHVPIRTTKTLELLLRKLPKKARRAFLVEDIPHNLVAVAELVDAGCSVHMYSWGFEIDLEGETIYRGWREGPSSRLFRMKLTDDGCGTIQPAADPATYDALTGTVCQAINMEPTTFMSAKTKNN